MCDITCERRLKRKRGKKKREEKGKRGKEEREKWVDENERNAEQERVGEGERKRREKCMAPVLVHSNLERLIISKILLSHR